MDFPPRKPRRGDFETIYRNFRYGCACPLPPEKEAQAVWEALLDSPASVAVVAEDGQDILGYYWHVFVTEEFARWIKTEGPPYADRLLSGQAPGCPRSLPTEREIALHNSGKGLILFTTELLRHKMLWEKKDDSLWDVRAALCQEVERLLAGYQIKEILHAASCEEGRDRACDFGLRLRRDYRDYYGDCPPSSHPYLMGLTREEALMPGKQNPSSNGFVYTPPRFFFLPREQAVLREALNDKTDKEIAKAMGRSVDTVKKHWGTIFSRSGMDRRKLLTYLRNHPEELRPYNGLPRNG